MRRSASCRAFQTRTPCSFGLNAANHDRSECWRQASIKPTSIECVLATKTKQRLAMGAADPPHANCGLWSCTFYWMISAPNQDPRCMFEQCHVPTQAQGQDDIRLQRQPSTVQCSIRRLGDSAPITPRSLYLRQCLRVRWHGDHGRSHAWSHLLQRNQRRVTTSPALRFGRIC